MTVLGWLLVLLGLAALILPGPGLLLLLSGLVLLSREHAWAARLVEPVRQRAYRVAKQGAATLPRILLSLLTALALGAVGLVWFVNPKIPTLGPFGPRLPAGGWGTGVTIMFSAVIALATIVYSIAKFHGADEPADQASPSGMPASR